MNKRQFLERTFAGISTLALAGCDRLNASPWFNKLLSAGEALSESAHRLTARVTMAQEFSKADLTIPFRANGSVNPSDTEYRALAPDNFAQWSLMVDGLVEQPAAYTLAQLRAMPSRTQITRHDCVEGWSSIGQWKGVQLSHVLAQVRPLANAKYVVFRCADSMDGPALDGRDSRYYESVDLDDANHVQTVLAYELNGQPLPVSNGAPLRVRIERQLGYKHAKYVMRIELVESFATLRGGGGGYWEDNGYEWYAGI